MDELAKIRRVIERRLPGSAASRAPRPGRDDRPERPAPGRGVQPRGRRHRHRADQARRQRQGRRGACRSPTGSACRSSSPASARRSTSWRRSTPRRSWSGCSPSEPAARCRASGSPLEWAAVCRRRRAGPELPYRSTHVRISVRAPARASPSACAARPASPRPTSTRRCARSGSPCSRRTSTSRSSRTSSRASASEPSARTSSTGVNPGPADRQDRPRRARRACSAASAISFGSTRRPSVLMMVGLQGSGKTTTAAKLAVRLRKDGKRAAARGGGRLPARRRRPARPARRPDRRRGPHPAGRARRRSRSRAPGSRSRASAAWTS